MSKHSTFEAGDEPWSRHGSASANADLFADLEWEDALDEGRDAPTPWRVIYPADLPEVLSAAEDLWMRIKRHPALRLHVVWDRALDTYMVLIRPMQPDLDGEAEELLRAVQDMGTFAWMQTDAQCYAASQPHSLVSSIDWAGDVLVIELTPAQRLNRQCGFDVECQVQGVLDRVQRCVPQWSLAAPSPTHCNEGGALADQVPPLLQDLKAAMRAFDACCA